jgi:hypothetical protein
VRTVIGNGSADPQSGRRVHPSLCRFPCRVVDRRDRVRRALEQIFDRYGRPRMIRSDNGREFMGDHAPAMAAGTWRTRSRSRNPARSRTATSNGSSARCATSCSTARSSTPCPGPGPDRQLGLALQPRTAPLRTRREVVAFVGTKYPEHLHSVSHPDSVVRHGPGRRWPSGACNVGQRGAAIPADVNPSRSHRQFKNLL